MDQRSLDCMVEFKDLCDDLDKSIPRTVMDVGSADVNGTYRPIWEPGWDYTGVDIVKAKNVDIIIPESIVWDLDIKYGVVISGQTIEHVKRPWVLVEAIGKHIVTGGLLFLSIPLRWGIHRYPVDCWRVLPDGMTELIDIAGCEVKNVWTTHGGSMCVGVGIKNQQ